jgi:hypothetical protein
LDDNSVDLDVDLDPVLDLDLDFGGVHDSTTRTMSVEATSNINGSTDSNTVIFLPNVM